MLKELLTRLAIQVMKEAEDMLEMEEAAKIGGPTKGCQALS